MNIFHWFQGCLSCIGLGKIDLYIRLKRQSIVGSKSPKHSNLVICLEKDCHHKQGDKEELWEQSLVMQIVIVIVGKVG